MSQKKISIITPFHNQRPEVFRRTSDSVMRIFDDEMEWIIVLHNTDQVTPQEIREITGNRDNVRIFELKNEHRNPATPRNLGLSQAEGEYIYLLDDDDEIEPDFIPYVKEKSRTEPYDIFIGSGANQVDDESALPVPLFLDFPYREGGYLVPDDPEIRGGLLYGTPMFLGSKLIRRSIIAQNQIRFDETIQLTEDVLFALECYVKAETICVLSSIQAFTYKQRGDSLLQRMMKENSFPIRTYLDPVDRIVELSVSSRISPSQFLWIMMGMFGVIINQEATDETRRRDLLQGIQKYLPYMSKTPPAGLTGIKKNRNAFQEAADLQDLERRFEKLINDNLGNIRPAQTDLIGRRGEGALYEVTSEIKVHAALTDADRIAFSEILPELTGKVIFRFLRNQTKKWRVCHAEADVPVYYKDVSYLSSEKQKNYLNGFYHVFETDHGNDPVSAGMFPVSERESVVLFRFLCRKAE